MSNENFDQFSFPGWTRGFNITKAGQQITDLMSDGVQVPSSIFDPADVLPGTIWEFQDDTNTVAFQVDDGGVAHSITPFPAPP